MNANFTDFFSGAQAAIDRRRLTLRNSLLDANHAFCLTLDGVDLTVRFSIERLAEGSPAGWAEFRLGDGTGRVALDRLDFLPRMRTALAEAPVPEALPRELFAAIMELLLAPAANAGGELLDAGPGLPPAESRMSNAWHLRLSVQSAAGQELATGWLDADEALVTRLVAALAPVGPEPGNAVEPDAVGRVQLRSITLPMDLFENLEPMDVLLLGRFGLGTQLPVRVFFAPGVYYLGTLEGEVITMQQQSERSQTEENPAGADPAPVDLGKIPVRIGFELGEVTVSLTELHALAAGSVMELPLPLDAPVTLKANGRVIGRGALLRVEDHVGVQILELFRGSRP